VKRWLGITNVLFILVTITALLPSAKNSSQSEYTIGLLLFIELIYIAVLLFEKNKEKVETHGDVTAIIYVILFLWELFTAKLNLLDVHLYPAPGEIVKLFLLEIPEMIKGFISSIQLLAGGYILALVTAIPLALFIGWRKRLYKVVKPLTKVLGPIPPIVYIPYAIAILPTFKAASVFVIFIGAFWPIFINTLNGVFNIDRRLIDSAKALNVKERSMLLEVILPGTLPAIFSGATIGLVLSFILLTAAEMIGATSGIGWYVKYFSDFADYSKVIVGIIFIGIVVTGITFFLERIEHYLLRWRK